MKKHKAIERIINGRTARALHDYRMIAKGDRVLVGVSGQDSLSLLNVLKHRSIYLPVKFKLIAAHVNLNRQNAKVIKDHLKYQDLEYHIVKADLNKGNSKKNTAGCFWCSWKRREQIFKLAYRLKCKKVVFAHHLDDIIETYLLNIFFQGQLSSMRPRLKMFGGKIHLIRPFAYLEKSQIQEYALAHRIPQMPYQCPQGKLTSRPLVRQLISKIGEKNPKVKKSIYRSMSNINRSCLPDNDF